MERRSPAATYRARERRRGYARGARERRGRRALIWAGRALVLVLVFLVGLVVGRALEQAPEPGGTQTLVRTLHPETVTPPETVTLTVPG